MRLNAIASNALNRNGLLDARRKARIATRFNLTYCEFSHAWHPEDDCVVLQDGRWAHHTEAYEYDSEWHAYSEGQDCAECHNRFPHEGCFVRSNGRNRIWCSPCFEDSAFSCEHCNETYSNEERADCDDAVLCVYCAEETRETIPSWHQATRPRIPHGKEDYPFWSLELELELPSESERSEFLAIIKDLNLPKLIWEKDGSLCSQRGIELIFCFYETKELLLCDLAKVCKVAKDFEGLSWSLKKKRNRWAGCHINRNRAKWTERELARLVYLIERNKSLLIRLAGRECDSYSPYSNVVLYGARRRLQALARGHQGKYSALNLSSRDRIEWRLFSGSLNIRRLEAYLNAVEGLERLAKGRALHYLARAGAEIIQNQIKLIETK